MGQADASIDLARAALAIALHEYPDLDVESYIRRIDEIAASTRRLAGAAAEPAEKIQALNHILFVKEAIRGNDSNYYDPRNSFLNEVLDRRTGIPISLSCLYIEVARRVGLKLRGVGLPGHFIVKHEQNGASVFLDPFNGGRILDEADCRRRVEEIYAGKIAFQPCFLEPSSKKAILSRLLGNLKGIYLRGGDFRRALWVVEDLLAIHPGCAEQVRDRGMIHLHLQHTRKAIADLDGYVRMSPRSVDAGEVKKLLGELRSRLADLN